MGKYNEISELPICIMFLTLEALKPRMCHDKRLLNLFIKDLSFKLDTLNMVPKLFQQDDVMIKTDDKSGYDHVLVAPDSRKFFGVIFNGWVLQYNTLPFGFKGSCFVYQT